MSLFLVASFCVTCSHYPSQAVACENWSDGPPTQVEEDLWDDSMLEVRTLIYLQENIHTVNMSHLLLEGMVW